MSQQSLASKTITKRNVAQSSVIFSVVVAVITLGVIGSVAYIDISENIESASTEKSIPDLIAEQKVRSLENHRQVEMLAQAEDLVVTMDKRVEELKQLDEKVKKVNEQLNFIATNLQTNPESIEAPTVHQKSAINAVKTVQHVASPMNDEQVTNNTGSGHYQQDIDLAFKQNHSTQMSSAQHMIAGGEGYLEFSWLFKARGKMNMDQGINSNHYLKTQFNKQLNGQSINAQTNWNAKSL